MCKSTNSYNVVGEEAYINLEFQLVELGGIFFHVKSLFCFFKFVFVYMSIGVYIHFCSHVAIFILWIPPSLR